MFIPDVADTDYALAIARRFRDLRGTAFDTGFVLRRFESYLPNESRTWWINGKCALVTAHPDHPHSQPNMTVKDLPAIEHSSPFFTADFARDADTGEPRLIEIGDGQVSDRPSTTEPEEFILTIAAHEV